MPRAHDVLPTRFRRAVLYVVQELGEVNVTKLQKILYLADLEHFNETGTTLTGARWVRYTHGPMAKALLPSTNLMDGHEVTVSLEPVGQYEARIYRPGPSPRFRPGLTTEERVTLDRIIALTRPLTAKDAIRLAYNTGPMRLLLRLEETAGSLMLDAEIPFEMDESTLADVASPTTVVDAQSRAIFKRRELDRLRDLRDSALATATAG